MEKNDFVSNDEFMQMIDNFASMESRITILEDKLKELFVENSSNKYLLMKDCIIINEDKFVCLKYMRKEPCILKQEIRKIGFDICIDEDSICPWALKIELKE